MTYQDIEWLIKTLIDLSRHWMNTQPLCCICSERVQGARMVGGISEWEKGTDSRKLCRVCRLTHTGRVPCCWQNHDSVTLQCYRCVCVWHLWCGEPVMGTRALSAMLGKWPLNVWTVTIQGQATFLTLDPSIIINIGMYT